MRRTFFTLLGLGFGLVVVQSSACHINDAPIDAGEECAAYCERAAECDEGLDVDECRDQCNGAMDRCLNNQKHDARDRLDECSDAACNDIVECSVDVGAECYFAIG